MPKKPRPLEAMTPEIVDQAEARVREVCAVAAKKLVDVPLSRAAQAELADALGRRGLEHTGKHVRVPLGEQLAIVLARDGYVSIAGLRRALRGTTSAAEVKSLVEHALRDGAKLVLRDGKEHLARAATLTEADLDALLEAASALVKLRTKLAKRVSGVRPTLLTEDVRLFLRPSSLDVAIVDGLRRGITPAEPFAYLPDLARRAEARDASIFRDTVSSLARAGRIELRPESGLGLLQPGDADWCPRAPDGALLSYARPTESV